MSKFTLKELAAKALQVDLEACYGAPTEKFNEEEQLKQYRGSKKLLTDMLRGEHHGPRLQMKEAVFAADFKILFPKAVESILQMPEEPVFIGQTLLARTVQVSRGAIMRFPQFGVIRAFEVPDSGEYPEQDPSFSDNATEIRTKKYGLKISVSDRVIEDSQWDILAFHIQAAGNALKRLKEEKIFNEYEARAKVAFDNSLSATSSHTTGKGPDAVIANGTFSHMDLLDMMAVMVSNQYNPTDLVLHPMAFSVWQKDPILRYQLLQRGSIGQNLVAPPADLKTAAAATLHVPFGLNVVISPFQKLEVGKTLATGVTGSAGNYTTITLVDRNSSILVLQESPVQIAQWDDPMRDMQTMRFREEYGLALLNGGRSAVTAKNVRIDLNNESLYTVSTVQL